MRFIPYNTNDADRVLEMLSRHFDYTPELASADNNLSNIDYFREAYCDTGYSGICYVLKADDESVLGFLEATKHKGNNGSVCWYITSLFVLADEEADVRACRMIGLFCKSLHDADEICANVHPAVEEVVRFWLSIGFCPNPERSIFTNSEDQRLIAYWKKLICMK